MCPCPWLIPGQSLLTEVSPLCPSLSHTHLPGQGQGPFLTLPIDHFKKPLFTAPRQNMLYKLNLYIWQIKLDIIVKKKKKKLDFER